MKTPTILIIMDGFGLRTSDQGNAVHPPTPRCWTSFFRKSLPHLSASGLDVGLPEGQMGNSEVGHTNIGAGRVVFQDLPKITKAITDGEFFENPAYLKARHGRLPGSGQGPAPDGPAVRRRRPLPTSTTSLPCKMAKRGA